MMVACEDEARLSLTSPDGRFAIWRPKAKIDVVDDQPRMARGTDDPGPPVQARQRSRLQALTPVELIELRQPRDA